MAVLYTTVARDACIEQVIEKSRFICHIKRVSSKEEAASFISSVKAEYKDATHNVPAYVIGDKMQFQWASDDGEPQGTAGAPIVQMLVKENVTNVAAVVTRYFGGIKLGTGGLVRAYTGSAKLALEAAGRFSVKEYADYTFHMPYSLYDKIKYLSGSEPFEITDTVFQENIKLTIRYEKDDEEQVNRLISELLKKS